MAKTTVNIGFKTRYTITAIDSDTQEQISPPVNVCNIVLDQGYLALGDEVSYTEIALGTSGTPTASNQTGLLNTVSTLPLADGTFEQINRVVTADIESVIKRTFVFKEFIFPSNLLTLDIREIGLVGRTRAVLPTPLSINRKTWVKVDLEIVYYYPKTTGSTIAEKVNGLEEGGTITYDITPIIFNPNPTNNSGKGYGRPQALRAYVYDGVDPFSSTFSQDLGVVVAGTLNKGDFFYQFFLSSPRLADTATLPGFVVRDTNNGVGYVITVQPPTGYVMQEDDSIDIELVFHWGPTIVVPI